MCGIVGCASLHTNETPDRDVLMRMRGTLTHRGPDSGGIALSEHVGLAVRRLSIIDVPNGDQPMENEDGTIVACCNGEIFNHQELRAELLSARHRFRTACDVEVLVHLYEEFGDNLVHKLNGQFSFAIHDRRRHRLLLARDHVGITPLHYTVAGGMLLFASEIKALLAHPQVSPAVDLTGLDQVLMLPGLVSPRTMFAGVSSLPPGHLLTVENGVLRTERYWDLDYPLAADLAPASDGDAADYADLLEKALLQSVDRRMRADVPLGYYLSGGLDSSLIAAMASSLTGGEQLRTFSVAFRDARISEQSYQRLMVSHLGTAHTELPISVGDLVSRLAEAVWHSECPLKESYNVASVGLSQAVRRQGCKVVLTGEGADELFAGYLGYKFDRGRATRRTGPLTADQRLHDQLWGNPALAYGGDLNRLAKLRRTIYAPDVAAELDSFDCLTRPLVDRGRLAGRHILHQRSYLDFKLRLADHLLGDHGDRVAMANSVETRYPYLDLDVIDLVHKIPPGLLLHKFREKHLLKLIAARYLPAEIVEREKFAFQANTSPDLVRIESDMIDQYLDPARIRREGYFNPDTVAELRRRHSDPDFRLDLTYEDDLLMVVVTHGMFLEKFSLPCLT